VLNGSLREGDHLVTVSASSASPTTTGVELTLGYAPVAGAAEVLATTTLSLVTPMPATQTIPLHVRAIASNCGDVLVLRAVYKDGTQTLFPFELSLDLP
jgi:hypothetical protein